MTTDWEEPSRSYCCQGRICQSKKLAGECLGKWGAGQNHQQGWSGGGGGGGQNFWFVAKHQGIEKECFSAMYIQMNVLKSPLNILWASMPYLLGEVICWRYKLFCGYRNGARDCVSQRQDMPSKLPNLPGSGTLHKCQERLHLQLRYRYVSLACYPRTLQEKSFPRLRPAVWGIHLVLQIKGLSLKVSLERELLTVFASSPAICRRWSKQIVRRASWSVLGSCSIYHADSWI